MSRRERPLRYKRYRNVVADEGPRKQLFTPEIKKLLKHWLVRRRKHPYPSRGEKKDLALKTGLTYMQICNWFANWRRKLRQTTAEDPHRGWGWGHMITWYHRHTGEHCEQFSISSRDTIWDEANYNLPLTGSHLESLQVSQSPARIIDSPRPDRATTPNAALVKWLESAARFRPRESRNTRGWGGDLNSAAGKSRGPRGRIRVKSRERQREELDAAEALTHLSTVAQDGKSA